MRAHIAAIPDGTYRSKAFVDSDGVVERAADHRARGHQGRRHADLRFRRIEPALRRADEQRHRHHLSSVYLAVRHIFPDVPISAGAFEPLIVRRPEGTFLDAHYPRPVSGCAAEVSQRIAEAVFAAWCRRSPTR
jgi:N-methylhydantoinase B